MKQLTTHGSSWTQRAGRRRPESLQKQSGLISIVFILGITGCATRATNWEDQSSVQAAMVLAHVAVQAPDSAPPIGRFWYGSDDRTREFLRLHTESSEARESLHDAVLARFGKAGVEAFALGSYRDSSLLQAQNALEDRGDTFFKSVDQAVVRISGDAAEIRDPADVTGAVLHARRIKGKWKIEFPNLGDRFNNDLQFAPAYDLASQLASAMAKEIKDGKYQTLKEAVQEWHSREKQIQALYQRLDTESRKRVMSPMTRPFGPATQPITQPMR